ncbi:MAG TPA: response regulator [Patescibacteria group bacterium]|nr:response regulator [Patescibacteria group bacterium]
MAATDQVRLLVVEDVPQVGQYIRSLLNSQQQIKLLDVMSDGSKVAAQIAQLRPDVVIVDALLQGRVKGPALIGQLHAARAGVPVIVLTVPQKPIEPDPSQGIHAVLSMPFSGYDLISRIHGVQALFQETQSAGNSKLVTVFAPKGGVGTTTIALNLAVAFGQAGKRTALIDGSLQFGDLRALLKVPGNAPSIVDLPTDRIAETDLSDVLWRDPSGIDILLAPPRVEQHEMISVRDLDKILSLMRRVYDVIVIDTMVGLDERTLALLDASDTIIEIVTFDSTTIHNTLVMADTFRSLGYAPTKVRYLVNRADSAGGIDENDLASAIGRVPEHRVVSDGRLVVQSNNEGVPFVLADPAARISLDVIDIANQLMAIDRPAVGARH